MKQISTEVNAPLDEWYIGLFHFLFSYLLFEFLSEFVLPLLLG